MTSALAEPALDQFGQIKAVCLDIDDTLLDNAGSSREGLRELIGHDRAWRAWRRTTDEHYARFLAGELEFDVMRRERTRAFFADRGEELSDREAAEREEHRMAAMQRAWRLFDDVTPCLEWLRASGLRLAVITNAPGRYQRKKMASVGLVDLFDQLIISGEVGYAKPHDEIFRAACTALDCAPEEVVHVGDRLDVDATAAARAGLHGVWLNRTEDDQHRLPGGVSEINSLRELPELLVCDLPATLAPDHSAETNLAGVGR